ncbi:kinase-like protein [Laetiporus sulphureus 93-53]|uniref:non-specific serine/threonine protein kinase n=1 Tax=Laetiporus sulphureus 93-53 TaxID=1314785 RepID=A0A165EPA0_9APHY|nr:kinase-like protein [Laetiporus sulphureus 93-53]KZT07479.1 kinase-like protein [Laetiporus sulphureus 93-53]
MSLPWKKRKSRLRKLLNAGLDGDDDAEGLALDRILHGQSVIGKTAKTNQVDTLRFSDKDLNMLGTLEYGQYGIVLIFYSQIDVVTCKLDGRVYVRKSTEKRFAMKIHDQCSPQFERDILLKARRTQTKWAPHLLCAFQTPTHLNLVMDYAEAGTMSDVLESSPYEGRIPEDDLMWWAPQIVSAIDWCHSQGFVHRDIKPNNFVLTPTSHLMLIDFGSAAPLLPRQSDGSQMVPKQHCLVPCGTCDYISPEILKAHEEALVEMEMADDMCPLITPADVGGYGRETDWWSMGAMLYEMVYGAAPFFAKEIRQTYVKIVNYYKNLKLDKSVLISSHLQDLLKRLLTDAELRLGRCSIDDLKMHRFFQGTEWSSLHHKQPPTNLHLPQFTYSAPVHPEDVPHACSPPDASQSRAYAFSALFQSSPIPGQGSPPETSHAVGSANAPGGRSILREQPLASFIGFSWGPARDAFKHTNKDPLPQDQPVLNTPRPLRRSVPATPFPRIPLERGDGTPNVPRYPFATPMRPNRDAPFHTLPRASTVRRTVQRRAVSDREAMKQLVSCVGMSARKRVLESGRKPRILTSASRSSPLKELRFDSSVVVVSAAGAVSYKLESVTQSDSTFITSLLSGSGSGSSERLAQGALGEDDGGMDGESDSDLPSSPSPSPRPGSAQSTMSKRSRSRSSTTSSSHSRGSQGSIQPTEMIKRPFSPPISLPPLWRPKSPLPPQKSHLDIFTADLALSDATLNGFDRRYAKLMEDISRTERRLQKISTKFCNKD